MYVLRCNGFQIYNEDLLDLLVPVESRDKDTVTIREHLDGIKVSVSNLFVCKLTELLRALHDRTINYSQYLLRT